MFDGILRRSIKRAAREARGILGPSGVASALRGILKRLDCAPVSLTVRELDRLWRTAPGECLTTLAPLYGRMLALEAVQFESGLNMLRRVPAEFPDVDAAALCAYLLLQMHLHTAAREQIDATLARYSCIEGELLWCITRELFRAPQMNAAGWIGRNPQLELVGELPVGANASDLRLRIDGTSVSMRRLLQSSCEHAVAFHLPDIRDGGRIDAECGGERLLGSGYKLPRDFALDGRTAMRGPQLTGWARLGWLPMQPPLLRGRDERGAEVSMRARTASIGGYRWPFAVNLHAVGLRGLRLEVEAQMPDGRWQALPDSPLLLPPALRVAGRRSTRLQSWATHSRRRPPAGAGGPVRKVDVIIPIYGGRAESLACIDSVVTSVDRNTRVVIVDDSSEDIELAHALDSLRTSGRITLLRNARNKGFVRSVNRALALSQNRDAVVLNSDAMVFGDWLARLRRAAYSASNVATVTPFTNSGSIASYPHPDGSTMETGTAAGLHALAAATHSGKHIQIPVGVGFCLYVRRDCLEAIGPFDAATFAMGYGEETDFCLRAREHGWIHLLAADAFVYHAGAVSFGSRRAALLERSSRILNLRYRGYDRLIADFLCANPLLPARRRLDEQQLLDSRARFVLLLTPALTGGINRYVTQRSAALRSQGLVPLLLRPARAGDRRRCEISTHALDTPNLQYAIPPELADLTRLLRAIALEWIEIQHFLDLDARLVDEVRALAPYEVVIHDYAWICPRITLIDGSGRYCGEPAVAVCQKCVERNGSMLRENVSVPELRSRSEAWLRGARRICAPSNDTAMRIRKHFAGLTLEVRPHTVTRWRPPVQRPPRDEVITVGLIGAIGGHKGFDVLLACATDASRRRLPLRFVVIGYTENDRRLQATGKVFVTGRYGQQELPYLLERENPDIALFASIWPETWCYALDEAIAAGLPIVAFDIGAIGERLRSHRAGTLLPLTSTTTEINNQLLSLMLNTRNRARPCHGRNRNPAFGGNR